MSSQKYVIFLETPTYFFLHQLIYQMHYTPIKFF